MKKQFIFTEDSSFIHIKDKMYQEATEHILQDEQTKRLYHHVVSYGSWFGIADTATFKSHLLEKIGATGFSKSYVADGCEISLPWYPHGYAERSKSIVEVPEGIDLEDIRFGIKTDHLCKKFTQTTVGKSFKGKQDGKACEVSGKSLLHDLFRVEVIPVGHFEKEGEIYPFYTILEGFSPFDERYKSQAIKTLKSLDLYKSPEIQAMLDRFARIDIKKEIGSFESELGREFKSLSEELCCQQKIVREYLQTKKKIDISIK